MSRLLLFLVDDEGATAIEYALIASLIFLAALGAMTYMGDSMATKYSQIASAVSAASS